MSSLRNRPIGQVWQCLFVVLLICAILLPYTTPRQSLAHDTDTSAEIVHLHGEPLEVIEEAHENNPTVINGASSLNEVSPPFNGGNYCIYQGYFGYTHTFDHGFDLVKDCWNSTSAGGTPVIAPASGPTYTWYNSPSDACGMSIYLSDNSRIVINHLSCPISSSFGGGKWVNKGTQIGTVTSTKPGGVNHIHFGAYNPQGKSIPWNFGMWNFPEGGPIRRDSSTPQYSSGQWNNVSLNFSGCLMYCAEYYNNTYLGGTPVFRRNEGRIMNNWGNGGPGNGVTNDYFSARYTGSIHFPYSANYNFYLGSDDGVRLWVDGTLVIDQWNLHPYTLYTGNKYINAGQHSIKIEYYEQGGDANVTFCFAAQGQYCAEYYNNTSLSGVPVMVRTETRVQGNWDTGRPGEWVGNDNFSVRWRGSASFNGWTNFHVGGDDGIRLWVGSIFMLNKWYDQPYTQHYARAYVTGIQPITLEYYEHGGGAFATFCHNMHDSYCAMYYPNTTLAGIPRFTRSEWSAYHNWGNGGPFNGPRNGIGDDNYSVRWKGRFYFNGQQHTLYAGGDDGYRVYIDGTLIINDWSDHGFRSQTKSIAPAAGYHDVTVEYYERGGGSAINVYWYQLARPANPNVVSTLYLPLIASQGGNTMETDDTPLVQSEMVIETTSTPITTPLEESLVDVIIPIETPTTR